MWCSFFAIEFGCRSAHDGTAAMLKTVLFLRRAAGARLGLVKVDRCLKVPSQ